MKRIQARIPKFLIKILDKKSKLLNKTQSDLLADEIISLFNNSKVLLKIAKDSDKLNTSFYFDKDLLDKIDLLQEKNIFSSNSEIFSSAIKQLLTTKNHMSQIKQDIQIKSLPKGSLPFLLERYDNLTNTYVNEMNRLRSFIKKQLSLKELQNYEISSKIPLIEEQDIQFFLQSIYNSNENLKKRKNNLKKIFTQYIQEKDIYQTFLSKIKGIGPILSSKLIVYFGNCSQYATVSKLWAHTGNHVVNGRAPKQRKGKRITYDPKLRRLTYQISQNLMRQNKGFYRRRYEEEKIKQQKKRYEPGYLSTKYNGYTKEDIQLSDMHIHNRSLRKIRKIFLDHFWHCARELDGLEAKKNYIEGIKGHTHIITWKDALKLEDILI